MRKGSMMKAKRALTGMSLDEMSKHTGIHAAQLGKYERGEKSPNILKLPVLAEAYDMTPEELVEHFRKYKEEE